LQLSGWKRQIAAGTSEIQRCLWQPVMNTPWRHDDISWCFLGAILKESMQQWHQWCMWATIISVHFLAHRWEASKWSRPLYLMHGTGSNDWTLRLLIGWTQCAVHKEMPMN
jgi:hypothetical protein